MFVVSNITVHRRPNNCCNTTVKTDRWLQVSGHSVYATDGCSRFYKLVNKTVQMCKLKMVEVQVGRPNSLKLFLKFQVTEHYWIVNTARFRHSDSYRPTLRLQRHRMTVNAVLFLHRDPNNVRLFHMTNFYRRAGLMCNITVIYLPTSTTCCCYATLGNINVRK